ncbi:MAG: hypothetical protein ACW99A_07725 [Candidatus Kariarchaeaceae archaeon]
MKLAHYRRSLEIITKLPDPAIEIVEQLSKHEYQTMTQEDIRSALSISTHKSIRYAIRRLLENGIIYRVANLLDMRSVSYRLATPNELSEAFAKLSDKVFQEVLEAMNISNSQLSEYKAFVKGT